MTNLKSVILDPAKPLPTFRVHGSLSIVANDDPDAVGRITRPVLLTIAAPNQAQAELWAFTRAIARYGLDLTYFNVGWDGTPRVTCIEENENAHANT